MDYKQIKQQIAQQTRPTPGYADFVGFKGISTDGKDFNLPVDSNPIKLTWDRYYYSHRRATYSYRGGVARLISKDFIPVLDVNSYNSIHPEAEEPDTVYNYWDYGGNLSLTKTNPDSLGNIYESNIPQDANVAYGISLSGGRRNTSNVTLTLEGDDISCSVWYVPKSIVTVVNNVLVFTTGTNRLQLGFPRKVTIPNGQYGTVIWVMFYKHYESEKSSSFQKSWIKISSDVSLQDLGASPVSASLNETPTWNNAVSSTNPTTHNVTNTLSLNRPSIPYWRGIAIYKNVFSTANVTLKNGIGTIQTNSGFVVSTSNYSLFTPNRTVVVEDESYTVSDVYLAKANRVSNGNFAQYSGSIATGWSQVASVPGTVVNKVTAYPFKGDHASNVNCLRLVSQKTNTAKSYYVEPSSYARIEDLEKPYLSFYTRLDSGQPTGYMAVRFFSSTNGTVCVPKHKYYLVSPNEISTVKPWTYYSIGLNQSYNSALPNFVPTNCLAIKPRFYSSNNSTSYSVYHLDAVKVSAYHYKDLFHTASNDRVVLKMRDYVEEPRKSLTTFNLYFEDTTKSFGNETYANANYNRPQYVDTSIVPFNRGMAFVSQATSYIQNGDFGGGTRLWTVSNLTYLNIDEDSPYNKRYASFISTQKNSSILQTYTGASGFVGSSAFSAAIWAKSPIENQQLRVRLDNNSNTQVSSVTFNLSTSWQQYTVGKKFSAAGASLRMILRVPTSAPSIFHLAGVQTEAKTYISDFNYLSTVGAGYMRREQGLRYTSASAIDWEYGTIRMWYTPKLGYNTAPGIARHLFHYYKDGTNQMKIAYDPSSQKFYSNYVTTYTYSTPMAFATGESTHIVFTWGEKLSGSVTDAFLYVNGEKGPGNSSWVTGLNTTGNIFIGCDRTSAEPANGIISNFRIDKHTWTHTEILSDYNSTKKSPLNNKSLKKESITYVGDITKQNSENNTVLEFVDNKDLLPNTTYQYSAAIFDVNRNEGPLSDNISIVTPRNPYEYTNVNKISNSSLEIYDNNHIKYWVATTSGQLVADTSHAFNGKKSVRVIKTVGDPTLDYAYFYRDDTSNAINISWYTHTAQAVDGYGTGSTFFDKIVCQYYNTRLQRIARREYTAFTTSNARSEDNEYWIRYSTAFSNSSGFLTYATAAATKYVYLQFGKSGTVGSLIDSIQCTEGRSSENTLKPYRESYIVAAGNLPPDTIDANSLGWGSVIGKHFKDSELLIGTATGDLGRIVIGMEASNQSFSVLSTAFFRWHSPGLATTSGWNYTKHLESGFGFYGEDQLFQARYYNWNGQPVTPILIITPKEIVTYSTAANVPQKLLFTQVATASGFNANAYLIGATGAPYSKAINKFKMKESLVGGAYANPSGNLYRNTVAAYEGGVTGQYYIQGGATVLPYRSRAANGSFEYDLYGIGGRGGEQFTVDLNFYCTSQSIREFSTAAANWVKIGSDQKTITNMSFEHISYFVHDRFATAKSFAVEISQTPTYYNYVFNLFPIRIRYSTSKSTIYKSGSNVGNYYWVAIDGGIIG